MQIYNSDRKCKKSAKFDRNKKNFLRQLPFGVIFIMSSWSARLNYFRLFCLISGEPVVVGVTMYILSISSVSEVMMVLANILHIIHVCKCFSCVQCFNDWLECDLKSDLKCLNVFLQDNIKISKI